MNLVRHYKLFLLSIAIPLKEYEIIFHLDNLLSDLKEFTISEFPNSIFYMKNGNLPQDSYFVFETDSDFIKIRTEDFDYYKDTHCLTHLDGIEIFAIFKYIINHKYSITNKYMVTIHPVLLKAVENEYKKI